MVYRSAKSRNKAKNMRTALLLMVSAFLILGGASYTYMQLLKDQVRVDKVTMCPVNGPTGITAVLIDSTDPFTTIQQEYLQKFFDELQQSIEVRSMIQVYSASDYSNKGFEPIVSLCNPGDGATASQWTENPERIRKRWKELFDQPLHESVSKGLSRGSADSSPLMLMLQSMSIQAFPLSNQDIPQNLIIVSDMLEHTPQYSQYSDSQDFDHVSRQSFFAHITPNLSGTTVTVLYVTRIGRENLQTTDHAEFWGQYFNHFGAILRVIKRI